MPTVELTDRWLRYHKVAQRTDFFDDGLRTFGVRISPSGRKVWFVLYSVRGERRKRRLVLGRYPARGLAEAREAARAAIQVVEKGGDPKLVAEVGGITFGELAAEYMARHARPKKRSADRDQQILDNELLPPWQEMPAAAIRKREVVALLDAIVDRGSPIQANRTRQLLSTMFRFGIKRDLVEINPVVGTDAPAPERPKSRYLSDDEIRALWRGTANMHGSIRDALRTILLTAQRPGEVAGMVRPEVDDGVWTIPTARHKGKRDHAVPLVGTAAELVAMGGSPAIFPSNDFRRRGEAIQRASLSYALLHLRRGLHWPPTTPHDLRRTAATQMGRLGVSRFVLGRLLGHSDGSVTGVYDRWEYLGEKRAALELWDRHVRSLVS